MADAPLPPPFGVGLVNQGNTCYINSMLQALRLAPPLAARTLQHLAAPPDAVAAAVARSGPPRKRVVALAWEELSRVMWSHDRRVASANPASPHVLVAHRLLAALLAAELAEPLGVQGDGPQFVAGLLDALHEAAAAPAPLRVEIVGANDATVDAATTALTSAIAESLRAWAAHFRGGYSPLVPAFYGQTRTTTTCGVCATASSRFQPWCTLDVSIPGADVPGSPVPTPGACLATAIEPSVLGDYVCDAPKCGGARRPATTASALTLLPQVIVLTMKRFTNAGRKVRGPIPWCVDDVDLRPLVAFDHMRADARYMAFATVEHLGSMAAGHYRTFLRTPTPCSIADDDETRPRWVCVDDSSVRPVMRADEGRLIVSSDTYALFLCRPQEWASMTAVVAPALWRQLEPTPVVAVTSAPTPVA